MQMSFRKVGGILLVTEVQSLVAKDESSLATFWLRFPGHTLVGDEHLPSRTQIRGKWLGLRSLPHVQSYVSIVMGFAGNCFPHFSPLFFPSFIRLDAPNQVFLQCRLSILRPCEVGGPLCYKSAREEYSSTKITVAIAFNIPELSYRGNCHRKCMMSVRQFDGHFMVQCLSVRACSPLYAEFLVYHIISWRQTLISSSESKIGGFNI